MTTNKEKEIIDCRYCNHCCCDSPVDKKADCFVEDEGYFSHHIKDPIKEAEECIFFEYCDSFPKW